MKRRNALAAICAALAGCGGGGSSGEEQSGSPVAVQTPQEPAAQAPTTPVPPAPPLGIAVWGDSLSNYSPQLQALYPERSVFNGSVGGQTSTQIKDRQLAESTGTKWRINIFCYGRNNPDKATVLADLAASVASLDPGNDKFIVLPIRNGDYGEWEAVGGEGYKLFSDLNAAIAAAYPDNYFDMRAYLVSKYDPTNAQDLKDFARDIPPSTLRSDALHLNVAGAQVQAERLKQYISEKGW